MTHNNNILKIIAFAFFSISALCFIALTNKFQLVKKADIQVFLTEPSQNIQYNAHRIQAQLDFWEKKLREQSNSSIYKLKTAVLLSEQFKQTGDIQMIHRSDSLLTSVLDQPSIRHAPYYRALSANAVTKHQFKEALDYADKSLESARYPEQSQLMRFDALMELGEAEKARTILKDVQTQDSFGFVIRKSKLLDHDGDLDAAIQRMEEAAQWCRERQNKPLLAWSMSNLGDMYGHAGRIQDSYQAYQDVLQLDPTYTHALKGIAWIAYAKDKNIVLARSIIESIKEKKHSPDLLLLLAELAAFEGMEKKAEALEKEFIASVSKTAYGNMYDRYLAEMYLDHPMEWHRAKFYIEKELANRPSAASYVLWADYQLKNGRQEEAIRTVEEKVVGKTFEPAVLYRVGNIYKNAGMPDKAKVYLEDAANASFELGPLTSKSIDEALKEVTFALKN